MKITAFVNERPSAWIPIVMSLLALSLVFGFILFNGTVVKAPAAGDEGNVAHFFQLLLIFQIPIIIYFVFKYLLKKPKEVFLVLLIQFFAGLLAFASIFIMEM